MANAQKTYADAVSKLVNLDEGELYTQLGLRKVALEHEPAAAAAAMSIESAESLGLERLGIPDFGAIGRNWFEQLGQQGYELMCGTGEIYKSERTKIKGALDGGVAAAGAALAAALVAALGWAPAIAAIVAAIIVKLFYNTTYEKMCALWKAGLPMPMRA